ncbi:glycosyl transferase [Microbacterium sp. ARD32]|uniref:glycosyl transferase n=1 Tax=Microbacterium sp. ARD32 TaxID=2962577 RepID=UPI002880F5FA|nr:glycosyl transferase [Microbacterium sp. ARD32]MDT0157078.1 glycosyl transferase [Microbacterium sp. ARD32]
MRFVWAVVAFVLATVLIGAGLAQRTIFMGPAEQRMELSVDEPAPYVVVDADVLRAHTGLQTLLVRGEGDVFVAYGRTADMTAWLSDTAYDHVSLTKSHKPKTQRVAARQPPADGGETSGRSPVGADLWLDSFADKDALVAKFQLTEGNSVLIARDGVQPAPDDILVSWALDTRTPWAGPLMAAGALMLAVGIVLYILGIRHQRRGRGPRRKGPAPLPETQPITTLPQRDEIEQQADAGTARRTPRARRRLMVAAPALVLTGLLATGCTADSWPQFGSDTPSPSPTPTVVTPENQKQPVVTEKQGQRIVGEIAATLAKADKGLDAELAGSRLTGAALDARKTEYTLRGAIAGRTTALVSPLDKVKVLLPEATDGWPRTALALTVDGADNTKPPVLLTMTQIDPWANYHVTSMAEMPASGEFPNVAPAWLGTTRVPADTAFLSLAPAAVADAFSDFVDAGDKSQYADRFDELAQKFAQSVRDSRQAIVDGLAKANASKTSKAAFDMAPATYQPLSLATLGSGAVVSVSVLDDQKITPTAEGAMVRFGKNPEVKALTGVSESAKGVEVVYGIQLFFAVPAQGSTEQIRLLAYKQDLFNAKVIK